MEDGRFSYLDPISFKLLNSYYHTYFGEDYQNLSFAIMENDSASIIVPCQKFGQRLHHNGAPINIHYAPGGQTRQKTQKILETLTVIMKTADCTDLVLRTTPINGKLDLLGDRFLKAGAQATPLFVSQIDLGQEIATIRQGFRKSYSPLINWGEKNMRLVVLDAHNPDKTLFDQIHDFHIRVAGRVTRSDETWAAQFDVIKAGCAEFIVGYLDDQLVSASLFIDEGRKTIYGVGIYERALFDRPLAHFVIYQGILRAKERGQKLFFMGDVAAKADTDDKLYNIGDFKKGFCPALTLETQWQLERAHEGSE